MEEISFIVLVDSGSYQELLGVIRGSCPGVEIASESFGAFVGIGGGKKDDNAQRLTFKIQEFRHEALTTAIVKKFGDRPKDSYAIHIRSGREC